MRRRIGLFAASLLAASAAFAAAAPAEGGSNLFAGDLGNMVWTLAIFLLVVFVLGKFAWGPLLETLQQRERFIRESLEKAKEERESAEQRLREYEQRLNAARTEATAIVEEGRRDGEVVRQRIEETAREEADKMVARAKREIDIAKQTAVKELYATSAELATEIASRIVERELDAKDHERLIAEALEELGRAPAN